MFSHSRPDLYFSIFHRYRLLSRSAKPNLRAPSGHRNTAYRLVTRAVDEGVATARVDNSGVPRGRVSPVCPPTGSYGFSCSPVPRNMTRRPTGQGEGESDQGCSGGDRTESAGRREDNRREQQNPRHPLAWPHPADHRGQDDTDDEPSKNRPGQAHDEPRRTTNCCRGRRRSGWWWHRSRRRRTRRGGRTRRRPRNRGASRRSSPPVAVTQVALSSLHRLCSSARSPPASCRHRTG